MENNSRIDSLYWEFTVMIVPWSLLECRKGRIHILTHSWESSGCPSFTHVCYLLTYNGWISAGKWELLTKELCFLNLALSSSDNFLRNEIACWSLETNILPCYRFLSEGRDYLSLPQTLPVFWLQISALIRLKLRCLLPNLQNSSEFFNDLFISIAQ